MPTLLSPGVLINEIDLTNIIPQVSSTEACMVGDFIWGPCNVPILCDSERELVRWFSKPTLRTYVDWYTCWNFLAYGDTLHVVRVVDQDNANTALRATNATVSNTDGVLVLNDEVYVNNYRDGSLDTLFNAGEWIAKYPGALGNSLKVSVCASANAFASDLTGTIDIAAGNTAVTGSNTLFDTELIVGDLIIVNDETHVVTAIASNTALTIRDRHLMGAAANTAERRWQYYMEVDLAPDYTNYANSYGVSTDEMHIVVVDEDGLWTDTPGDVLEVFSNVSKASDAQFEDGRSAYYLDVIDTRSKYIRWASHAGTITNAGDSIKAGEANSFGCPDLPLSYSLDGGKDGTDIGLDERIRGYDLFQSKEQYDISLILTGATTQTLATYVINNLAEKRMDCVVFISPPANTCIDNEDQEADDIINFRNLLPSTSYAFMDSGWKYQYDKHNDVYRYVPLNGDIAGLAVRTDMARDPWWSFAGLNRGMIKNVEKLAWNPRHADRDQLYKSSINPVVTQRGDGTFLKGDKTLLAKPSAFDRINVRRLFIVLEKAIGKAAEYFLFEFNDEITRTQFVNMVDPYLREIRGRRGITDFHVECSTLNNTPEVIDRNEFIADIYIKPNRVINFIYLNFIAVRTGIAFSEVVGRW